MSIRTFYNRGLPPLIKACLLASASVFASVTSSMAQSEAPLVVSLSKDTPERTPGLKPDPKSLEGGIWGEAAKAEREAKTSGERNSDPALEAYVSGVESRLAGPFSSDIRLYVMDRPFFNATVSPNGYAEVWSGLLLRVETEDQLAFVLGHETGHFRHSHSLKRYQEMKNGQNAALAVSLVIAVAGAAASANATSYQSLNNINGITNGLINVTYLGTVAVLMSYSRETEAQADAYGLSYASQNGYFPGAGGQLWQALINETAASDSDKVRRSGSRNNIFGSHPLERDRVDALNSQDRQAHGGMVSTRTEADEKLARLAYRGHIRPFLGRWLKDDLRRKDYGQTIFVINRLAIDGEDAGVLSFYKAEAYRLRGKPDDLNAALDCYLTALKAPDAPVETQRQLGDLYRRIGNPTAALAAFNAYLAAAPDAEDAWMVQDQIDTINKAAAAAAPAATTTSQGE